ncbi:HipA family kinase [Bacillus taeanensis]|uniref:HipA-like kinase domain-containing protein n=1 Tax=Bacillus taeanensis TaxID=273032 RepID=A0A366XVM8_9BACI|nr:HipA family kinase [Bacillus taeanensis]RBW69957.1 hypothetical protein DS031_08875 [Bacillus taeanensis]
MIQPITYLKLYDSKNAHLISFDDGNEYIVKFFQPDEPKILCNEWIGYCFARFLGLPIPPAKIVQIPKDFYEKMPTFSHLKYTPHQFASLYIPNCRNGHQTSITHIRNTNHLAAIILLDYWIYNTDRTKKNILLKEHKEDTHYLYIIDHAKAFGSTRWSLLDLSHLKQKVIKSATHSLMASFIIDEKDFKEQVKIIQSIPRLMIEEIVSFIPADWELLADEREALIDILVYRRDKVLPYLVHKFIKDVYWPLHKESKKTE